MDYLRKAYSTTMSFARDGSQVCPIRWYFTRQGAPDLPFTTPFRSLNWWHWDEGPGDVLGEQLDVPRPVANGMSLIDLQNEIPCGTADQWRNGFDTEQPFVPATIYGTNACCGLPDRAFIHYDCRSCPSGSYDRYTLIVEGGTGGYAQYNGTYVLTYRGGCTWNTNSILYPGPPPFDAIWQLRSLGSFPTNAWRVNLLDLVFPPLNEYDSVPVGIDCLQFATVPATGVLPPGQPPFVLLLPGDSFGPGPFCLAQGQFLAAGYRVRVGAVPFGLGNAMSPQDAPLINTRPCVYVGLLTFRTSRIPGPGAITVNTPVVLTFGAGGLVTLTGRTPSFLAYSYTATLPAWDQSPASLLLTTAPFGGGLPMSVLLYAQDDLPP